MDTLEHFYKNSQGKWECVHCGSTTTAKMDHLRKHHLEIFDRDDPLRVVMSSRRSGPDGF